MASARSARGQSSPPSNLSWRYSSLGGRQSKPLIQKKGNCIHSTRRHCLGTCRRTRPSCFCRKKRSGNSASLVLRIRSDTFFKVWAVLDVGADGYRVKEKGTVCIRRGITASSPAGTGWEFVIGVRDLKLT